MVYIIGIEKYKMRKAIFFACLFLLALRSGLCQKIGEYNEYKKLYPDKIAVIIDNFQELLIDFRADSIYILQEDYERKLYLNNQAKLLSNDQVYVSGFTKSKNLEAYSYFLNKNKYKEVKVNDFYESHDMASSVFYDDFTSISFTYPSLENASQSVLKHSFEYSNIYILRAFYFGSYLPVVNSKLTIRVNENIQLNYKIFNAEKINIDFNKTKQGKYWIYEWKASNVKEYLRSNRIAGIQYVLPHIIFYIGSYKKANTEVNVLNSIDDLYKWYYGFIENLNKGEQQELNKLVKELTKGEEYDLNKAKNIYYWVQDNINYIAFEQGMRGYIPHKAIFVYNQKYGDCKDMASLLTTMLNIAGLESHITWVGTREIPYSYYDIPTPVVDNHMISTYITNDSVYFLDATAQYTPFGIPSYPIQGKEALIECGRDSFKILKVPVLPKEYSGKTDSCEIYIDGKTVRGKGKTIYKGYTKSEVAYSIDGLQNDQLKNRVTEMLKRGNNKFFINSYSINNLLEKEKPLIIEYDFKTEDYFTSLDNELYINLSLDKSLFNRIIEDTINLIPVENDFLYIDSFYTELIIPENYHIEYLPENKEYSNELIGFSIKYEKTENSIIQKKNIYFDFLMIKIDKVYLWDEMIKELSRVYRESIILKK